MSILTGRPRRRSVATGELSSDGSSTRGLIADRSRVPWLIQSKDPNQFLDHRRAKSKTKLALHHLFCLGSKAPQEPDGKFAEYT